MRRSGVMLSVVLAIAMASTPAPSVAQEEVSPRVDASLAKGLECLAARQLADGSFQDSGPKVAITSLCMLAYFASGHVAGDGRYGQTVHKSLDFVLDRFPEDGYVGRVDNSRMYGQGIVTLALAEAYGVERDPARRRKIYDALQRSVKVIVAAQDVQKAATHAGGWRYEPGSPDSDLSLSGWNALALRACNNIGISVDKAHIDRAAEYVLRCYHREQRGFSYQPGQAPSAAMTAVGILNLIVMDRGSSWEVRSATEMLQKRPVDENTRFAYYAHYYVTHAALRVGEQVWPRVWKDSSERLIKLQLADGSWPQSRTGEEPGAIYATAMSVLTLSAPNRLVPVNQK